MIKHRHWKLIILGLLAFTTLADIFMALLVKFTKPVFLETNPIYLATGSFSLVVLAKLFAMGMIGLYFYKAKYYYKMPTSSRFLMSFVLLCAIIGQAIGAYSGIAAYRIPNSAYAGVSMTKAELQQEYYSGVYGVGKAKASDNVQLMFLKNFFLLMIVMYLSFKLYTIFEVANYEQQQPYHKY